MVKPVCCFVVSQFLPWELVSAVRSFPSLSSFSTLLIPCWATSATHMPLILKPADLESFSNSSHNGS